MTLDQYSAHTTTGKSVVAVLDDLTRDWQDGLMTDYEFLHKLQQTTLDAARSLENPVQ